MPRPRSWAAIAAGAAVACLGIAGSASAQSYRQHNLVSDGAVPADRTDPHLVNAWGLAASSTGPWWVADNETDVSTLYNEATHTTLPLVVSVPGAPTGIVFNSTAGFEVVPGVKATFIFDTEAGTIRAWNPNATGTNTFVMVDRAPDNGAFKGLAIASTPAGPRLYATNFHAGAVEVYDGNWTAVPGGFVDPWLPKGYSPFGIQAIGNSVFVTYALRDDQTGDDVAGPGHGFVDEYSLSGAFVRRVASRGVLNSPWGIALAPDGFGRFSHHLLIGNFGDGRIHAFKQEHGRHFELDGRLRDGRGRSIAIDGLWALQFGNGANAGSATTLFFTAGPNDEANGLFGSLDAVHHIERDDDR